MEREKDHNSDKYNFTKVDRAKLLSYDTFVKQTNQKVRVISLQYVYKILSSYLLHICNWASYNFIRHVVDWS